MINSPIIAKKWAYYNDNDPGACAWIRELIKGGHVPLGEVDERSILDVCADDLRGFTQCHFFAGILGWSYALRLAGWPDDRPVWTGSPPCQPFSAAGRQEGRNDARHLAPHFISLVGAARPGMLFGEQVASAEVFGKAAGGARKRAGGPPAWAWLDDLSDRLEAARYAVGASDFPSAGVGAPHIRQRTFFGAVSLADADDAGLEGWRQPGRERDTERLAGASGLAGGLADAERLGRDRRQGLSTGRQHVGADAGWLQDHDGSVGFGEIGLVGLADADSARPFSSAQRGIHRSQEGTGTRHGEPERLGATFGLADNQLQQRQIASGLGDDPRGRQQEPAAASGLRRNSRPGPTNGFWRDADWLGCRDGKWRPVKSSVLGLADGIPDELVRSGALVPASSPLAAPQKGIDRNAPGARRVMRLRGYGNAINPWAAKEFIQAFDASVRHLRMTDLSEMPTDAEDIFG